MYSLKGYSAEVMGYGVELSSKAAKKSKPRTRSLRGPKGVDRNALLEAAFALLSSEGEAGFSIRKLAAIADVDPMTVLHHFHSKDELLRQIADRALETVDLPMPSDDWRADLRKVANGYRALARRHPRVFHLHFRFNATGPADHASSEVVYRAMRKTGLPDAAAAGLGLAFYAFVLGFAQAEIEGLLLPLNDMEEAEMRALDPLGYPATQAFIPAFKKLNPDTAFDAAVTAFIDGVALRAKARR